MDLSDLAQYTSLDHEHILTYILTSMRHNACRSHIISNLCSQAKSLILPF